MHDAQLLINIQKSKVVLKKYQQGHLAYHWPLINGKSRITNSPFLSRWDFFALSPDADCSCLVQMATQNNQIIENIVDALSFYRADNKNFRLPGFQKEIAGTENTFLTWFPPKESCRGDKLETIDIAVDCNILWFLSEHGKLTIPGAGETINFIKRALSDNIILNKAFEISPYYPFPLVILYHISRAIHWGKLTDLYDAGKRIISLANKISPGSSLDNLLLAAIGCYFKNPKLIKKNLDQFFKRPLADGTLFVSPLLFPLAQHFRPVLWLAKSGLTHIKFNSESFMWAVLLWIIQTVKNDRLLPLNKILFKHIL